MFITDFVVGNYIQIQNSNNSIFQIKTILSNTQMILNTVYTGDSGIYNYKKTGVELIGIGTDFITELNIGDNIIINDGGTFTKFIVDVIHTSTKLTLTTPYNGLSGTGLTFSKNNSITDTYSVFFGSKRLFIQVELRYLST